MSELPEDFYDRIYDGLSQDFIKDLEWRKFRYIAGVIVDAYKNQITQQNPTPQSLHKETEDQNK